MAAWTQKTGRSQADFAKQFGMPGGSSMISQHKANHRPLSLDHARAYMAGFECRLSDLSPALAASVEGIDGAAALPVAPPVAAEPQATMASYIKPRAAPTLEQSLEVLALHINQIPEAHRDAAKSLLSALVASPTLYGITAAGIARLCASDTTNAAAA